MEAVLPGSPNESDGSNAPNEPVLDVSLKHILSNITKHKRTGVPMPSSENRRKERKRQRQAARNGNPEGATAPSAEGDDQATSLAVANAGPTPIESPHGADEDQTGPSGLTTSQGATSESLAPTASGDPVVVAPQVTFDDDGNIVIDQDSLVVAAAAENVNGSELANVVTVTNNDPDRRVTSASFAKRDSAVRWSPDDNAKFYESLSKYGTDFTLLQHAFPRRSRRQIKAKFKREERENLEKVNRFLRLRTPMSLEEIRNEFGLDDKVTTPQNQQEADRNEEADGNEQANMDAEAVPETNADPEQTLPELDVTESVNCGTVEHGESTRHDTPDPASLTPTLPQYTVPVNAGTRPAAPADSSSDDSDEDDENVDAQLDSSHNALAALQAPAPLPTPNITDIGGFAMDDEGEDAHMY